MRIERQELARSLNSLKVDRLYPPTEQYPVGIVFLIKGGRDSCCCALPADVPPRATLKSFRETRCNGGYPIAVLRQETVRRHGAPSIAEQVSECILRRGVSPPCLTTERRRSNTSVLVLCNLSVISRDLRKSGCFSFFCYNSRTVGDGKEFSDRSYFF